MSDSLFLHKDFRMKKVLVFIALFVIPIVAYLFFASGVNSFVKLPTITENIAEIPSEWKSNSDTLPQLKDRITVLGFVDDFTPETKAAMTNLCHEVYLKNKRFFDLQVVYLVPEGTEAKAAAYEKELSRDAELSSWHYVFTTPENIQSFFNQLRLKGGLSHGYTPYVFIVDKDYNLRGRKGKNKKGVEEYKEGYDSTSPADLHNEMEDDVKVILAEYRLALKKNYRIQNPQDQ